MRRFESLGDVFRELAEREERERSEALGMTLEGYRRYINEQLRACNETLRETREIQEARRYEEEIELGRALGLGIRVRPAIAMRLSGLRMGSRHQNGAASNTVVHLYLLEPFERGRLKRKARRFLCRPEPFGFDVSLYRIREPVTCPKCLELIARHGHKM